jgi:hypothetical protein
VQDIFHAKGCDYQAGGKNQQHSKRSSDRATRQVDFLQQKRTAIGLMALARCANDRGSSRW